MYIHSCILSRLHLSDLTLCLIVVNVHPVCSVPRNAAQQGKIRPLHENERETPKGIKVG